jgi:2Fe-2S ferredoxin
MPRITFNKNGESFVVEAVVGETLLESAQREGIDIFAGCGGAGVCGSCYVTIENPSSSSEEAKSEEENTALPRNKTLNSNNARLACQVIIYEDMDGMIVNIP